jgi:hypothetical protein
MICISNIAPFIFTHIFTYFIANTMAGSTQGQYVFYFELLSPAACRFSRFASFSGENETAYLTALFSLERLIVITFPFKAHMFTKKRSAVVAACAIIQAIGINCSAFYAYGLSPLAGNYLGCSPIKGTELLIFAVYIINFVIPNCLLFIIAVLIFKGLQKTNKNVHKMGKRENDGKRASARRTTVILLALAIIRCIVYVPDSVLYITWQFIADRAISTAVRIFSGYFDILTGFVCIGDFIVYLIHIPDFRRRVGMLLTCKAWYRLNASTGN